MKQKHLIYSLLLLLPLAGCGRRAQHYERSSVSVDAITLHAAENRNMHTYSGTTEARTSIPLSFPLGGQIVRVCVRNGQYVSAGTVIAVTDSANAASSLRLAEAGLRQAQDGYDRMMQVHRKGGVTEVKRMEVETQLERARQMAEIARQELSRCIIRAPQSGTVSDLNLSAGQVLAPGQRVCNLIDTGGMMVRFSVAENDIASLREGDSATVSIPAIEAAGLKATVVERDLVASQLAHTYSILLSLTSCPASVRPGMVCKVQLNADRSFGFCVPTEAVQTNAKGRFVWVLSEGKATRRFVTIAGYMPDGVMVTSGLEEGEEVVTNGCSKLFEGAEVQIHSIIP